MLKVSRGISKHKRTMADILHMRYCQPQSLQYNEIGEELDISAQHARRLAARALQALSAEDMCTVLDGAVDRGTRLWEAIQRTSPI